MKYIHGETWKNLEQPKDLFIWALPATLVDIQPHFAAWYKGTRTQCRTQDLSNRNDLNNDSRITQ